MTHLERAKIITQDFKKNPKDVNFSALEFKIAQMMDSVVFVTVERCISELKTTKIRTNDTIDKYKNKVIKQMETVKYGR